MRIEVETSKLEVIDVVIAEDIVIVLENNRISLFRFILSMERKAIADAGAKDDIVLSLSIAIDAESDKVLFFFSL